MTNTCPFCGEPLIEVNQKIVCSKCHRIIEGCCEEAC